MNQNWRAITSTKKWMDQFVFLSWRLGNTWNLNFEFKFQVIQSCQDRKPNLFVRFLGEVMAQQFCFKIYWPLAHQLMSTKKAAAEWTKYVADRGNVWLLLEPFGFFSQTESPEKFDFWQLLVF